MSSSPLFSFFLLFQRSFPRTTTCSPEPADESRIGEGTLILTLVSTHQKIKIKNKRKNLEPDDASLSLSLSLNERREEYRAKIKSYQKPDRSTVPYCTAATHRICPHFCSVPQPRRRSGGLAPLCPICDPVLLLVGRRLYLFGLRK